MESRKMSLSRSWIQDQQFVLKRIVAVLVLFCCAVTGNKNGEYEKIFIIGDSYADNGNRIPDNNTRTVVGKVNQPWTPPYGRTRPGSPAGRFSDGKMLSDYLADYMGLKPRPYRVLSVPSLSTHVRDGINFAVGGAGVFDNLGFTKTGDQIAQLKLAVLNRGEYTKKVYSESLIFYSISGNDYAAFLRNNYNNPLPIFAFVTDVVTQITQDLRALYDMGFRGFVVSKLAPVGCNPAFSDGYTACNETFNFLATSHNTVLFTQVTTSLPTDAKILFLDNELAFSDVLYNNFTNPDRLKPCCTGLQNGKLCGDVDSANNPQYTLCSPSSQNKYFFWDEFHPTEAGWGYIFNLFKQDSPPTYTDGKSLRQFLGM